MSFENNFGQPAWAGLKQQMRILGVHKMAQRTGVVLVVAAALSLPAMLPAAAQALDQAALARLEQTIQQQQQQLQELRQQLDQLKRTANSAQTEAKQAQATANKAMAGSEKAPAGEKVVTSGKERIKLAISGQVNRMINVANDGETTKVFHVDNDNSSTRVRLVGTGKVNDDLTIGSAIEVQLESNSSASVSQISESAGSASFTDRKVEAFFASKTFGKLSIGQGSMASDGTAEVDLSGTDVVAYSAIADLAGGLLFRNSTTGLLTGVAIGDVYNNFDGLSRNDRLRYDSPSFVGFEVAASHASDDQWDVALRWGGEVAGFQIGAAGAYASNNSAITDRRVSWSTGLLHVDSGLNLAVSGGGDSNDGVRNDADSLYVKAGWRGNLFSIGETAFSVDWARNEDIAQNGDEATSIGGYVVQSLSEFGTELYGGIRNHELDRPGTATDDLLVITAGTRVKF